MIDFLGFIVALIPLMLVLFAPTVGLAVAYGLFDLVWRWFDA